MDRRQWLGAMGGAFMVGLDGARGDGERSTRLPHWVGPELGCWFWREREFEPDGYRASADLLAEHASYSILTTSIRAPLVEVTQPAVHDQIAAAARYALDRGMRVAMDLDVRLAREAFRARYPDELQEMLRLRTADAPADGAEVRVRIVSEDLNDHYTGRTTHYIPLAGRVERVYRYRHANGVVAAGSAEDVTAECAVVEASSAAVEVSVPAGVVKPGDRVALLAVFTHLTPDVFAPHLLSFQREILESYADIPLAGACKDEWGFPPCFDAAPAHNDYWHSPYYAQAYAERTGGRDLVRDYLLMYAGEEGKAAERQAVINHYMALTYERNVEIEQDFYRAVKDVWGPDALVATHPTWFPFPDAREIRKNGLSWWAAARDLAQTDETTPYCCRTALAKKWRSSAWHNMFYAPEVERYECEVWSAALAGGRVNYHQPYPVEGASETHRWLLMDPLATAQARVRLLNLITEAPLDCRVAVVFGHACAMNWAGPGYPDAGVAVAEAFWLAGYPADLIPSSEIANGALRIERDGRVLYGEQEYDVVVLYQPEFEGAPMADFMERLHAARSLAIRFGEWTVDFEGRTYAHPDVPTRCESIDECLRIAIAGLRAGGQEPGTPAVKVPDWGTTIVKPPLDAEARLLDGTHIVVKAVSDRSGDPIAGTLVCGGRTVRVDAAGLLATRFDRSGALEALVAGGLRRFQGGGVSIRLEEPLDVALWRGEDGAWRGAVQGLQGAPPRSLLALTDDWLALAVPPPSSVQAGAARAAPA